MALRPEDRFASPRDLADGIERWGAERDVIERTFNAQEIFVNNVAHDLRTPLTVIVGYGEELHRRAKKEGLEAFIPDLKLIVSRGNDLLELINDLLNVSRSIHGKSQELDLAEFDIARMLQGCLEGIEYWAKKYGNSVELECPEQIGSMRADPRRVRRTLMSCLTNACKFTKDGTIALSAARERSNDRDWVVFRVADSGSGMYPDQLQRIKDMIKDPRRLTGLGMGLTVSLLYCRLMGGDIDVASKPGKGSVFTIRLPARVAYESEVTG
jgi:signal transduction histidine kinase